MIQTVRTFSNGHKFFSREFVEQKKSIKNVKAHNTTLFRRDDNPEEPPRSLTSWLMASEVITGLSIPSIPSGESFLREDVVIRFSMNEKYRREFGLLKGLFSLGKYPGINVQADSSEKFFTVSLLKEREENSIEYFQQIFQWLVKEVKFKKVIREVVRFEQKIRQEQAMLLRLLQN
jgi:hypothetical protein